jgi:hypothetical protein
MIKKKKKKKTYVTDETLSVREGDPRRGGPVHNHVNEKIPKNHNFFFFFFFFFFYLLPMSFAMISTRSPCQTATQEYVVPFIIGMGVNWGCLLIVSGGLIAYKIDTNTEVGLGSFGGSGVGHCFLLKVFSKKKKSDHFLVKVAAAVAHTNLARLWAAVASLGMTMAKLATVATSETRFLKRVLTASLATTTSVSKWPAVK